MTATNPGTVRAAAINYTPPPPPPGYVLLYFKTDNTLYVQGNDAIEHPIGTTNDLTGLTGDVNATGPGNASATVVAIQNKAVSSVAPTDAQLLVWSNLTSRYNPVAISGDVVMNSSGAAIVNSVGSSSASDIHQAEVTSNSGLITYSGSGLNISYKGMTVIFNGIEALISSGTLTLPSNTTNNWIYVDTTGIVSVGASLLPNSVPLALFTTSLGGVTSLEDARIFINKNQVWGLTSDIQGLNATASSSSGTSEKFSRADHIHSILTGAPVTNLSSSTSNAAGSSSSLAKSDHSHAISTGVPSTQNADQSNAAGSSANLAKADHIHDIPTDVPVNTGAANAQGSSTKFAKADHVHNVPVANGLQNVVGTLSPVYGSTSNTVVEGNDNRLSTENVVLVKMNPGAGEFSSIATALASITTASSTNPYLIFVGPGVYVEPQIVMISYVSIQGSGPNSTVVTPSNNNQNFIVGAPNSALLSMTISGVSGSSGKAVYYKNNTAGIDAFSISDITFRDSTICCYIDGSGAANSLISVDNVTITGTFATGLAVISSGGFVQNGYTGSGLNVAAFTASFAPTDEVLVDGSNSFFSVNNLELIGSPFFSTGNGIRVRNGGSITSSTILCSYLGKGIYVENVGVAPTLAISGYSALPGAPNTIDLQVDHPTTSGTIQGVFRTSVSSISSSLIDLFVSDPTDGITFTGALNIGTDFNDRTDVTNLLLQGPTMGLYSGGEPSDGGGLVVNLTAGFGYLSVGANVKRISWNNTSITLTANTESYVFFNSSGILSFSGSQPNTSTNILIGRVITTASAILFIDDSPLDAANYGNTNDQAERDAFGPIFSSGCIVTENVTPFHLDITQGHYVFANNHFTPSATPNASFQSFYGDGSGGSVIASTSTVNNSSWDNGSGTLAALTVSFYARHALYLVGQGSFQKLFLVFSQTQYATLVQAENGTLPLPPSYFQDAVVLIASIIVQQGASNITEIRDERPVIGFKASGTNSAIIHGNLLGLTADDHKQYLLVDGSRSMSGNLDMGGNNINNPGTVDGVIVHAHASRHLPNGADPLATAAPTSDLNASTSNVTGIQNSLARSDHSHAIDTATVVTQVPNQSNAAGSSSSLSRADHIHNIPSGNPVQIGTSNNPGSAASFSLSDHVHAITSSVVLGLVLTGYSIGSNAVIAATDTILQALGKIQGQISSIVGYAISSLTGDVTGTGPGSTVTTISIGAVTDAKASLSAKPACVVVSTTNQALSGLPTIDGRSTVSGDLVLLSAQTSGAENGPWVTASGSWSRPTWYPSGGTTQGVQFSTTLIRLGTIFQGSVWRMTTPGPITIDTTSTAWVVTPLSGNYKAQFVLGPQSGSSEVDLTFNNGNAATLGWNPSSTFKLLMPPALPQAGQFLYAVDNVGTLGYTNPQVNIDGGVPNSIYTSAQIINGGTP